jgi:hypothetical protein
MLLSSGGGGGLGSYLSQDTGGKVFYFKKKIAPLQYWSLFRRVLVSYSRPETSYGSALLTTTCRLPGSTLQVEVSVESS